MVEIIFPRALVKSIILFPHTTKTVSLVRLEIPFVKSTTFVPLTTKSFSFSAHPISGVYFLTTFVWEHFSQFTVTVLFIVQPFALVLQSCRSDIFKFQSNSQAKFHFFSIYYFR